MAVLQLPYVNNDFANFDITAHTGVGNDAAAASMITEICIQLMALKPDLVDTLDAIPDPNLSGSGLRMTVDVRIFSR